MFVKKMIFAQQKRRENIVEYILYIWYIEDLIRAYAFNLEKLEKEIISNYNVDEQTYEAIKEWYDNIIQHMLNDKVEESGHIQPIRNLINELNNFHLQLLNSVHHYEYRKAFEGLSPYVEELLMKAKAKEKSLIEIFLESLYGIILLRMKKEQISAQTNEAIEKIADFMALLAKKYYDYENDENFKI